MTLLRQRMLHLAGAISQMETHLTELARQDMNSLMSEQTEMPPLLEGYRNFRRCSSSKPNIAWR